MKPVICFDANLYVPLLLPVTETQLSQKATDLFRRCERENVQIVAPVFMAYEVISVLRLYVHLGKISPEQGREALADFERMAITYTNRRAVLHLAWKMARQFDQPRIYDMSYLAVASLYHCEFWTADKRLHHAVTGKLPWVKPFGP